MFAAVPVLAGALAAAVVLVPASRPAARLALPVRLTPCYGFMQFWPAGVPVLKAESWSYGGIN